MTADSSNDWRFASAVPPAPGPKALQGALPRGTVVDERYEVVDHLGSGGMGAVHRVKDLRAGREVALKLLTRIDAGALLHFEREGSLLARVDHPNVVRVHAAGRWNGAPYLVLELIPDAEPLDRALARVGPRTRVEWLAQVADGVAACHAAGLVHRDLKPTNVLVGAPGPGQTIGRPRVTDFGLAIDPAGPRVTEPGTLLGTPAYMPPEVLVGDAAVVPQADVWSLGVMLHEALAGAHPFPATSLAQLGFLLSREAPPVRVEGPAPTLTAPVRKGLEALVVRSMSRAPARRPSDAAAFGAELRRLLAAWPPEVTPSGQELPSLRARRDALRLGAVALAGCGLLALLALRPRPPARDPAPAPPPPPAPVATSTPAAQAGPAAPTWFSEAERALLPPHLPTGVRVGAEPWTYVLERDPATVLCWVPPGELSWPTAEGRRLVRLERGLFLGRDEVTFEQLARVLGRHELRTPDPGALARGVDWVVAQRYCRRLGLRLPTEREWLRAALGPRGDSAYPWGEREARLERGERCAFGLRGLGGGVLEWTLDLFTTVEDLLAREEQGRPPARDGPVLTPFEPPLADARRVVRGGAVGLEPALARNAERRGVSAENALATSPDDIALRDLTGLRVALDLEPDPSLGPVRWRFRGWEGRVGLERGPPSQERYTDDLDVSRARAGQVALAVECTADVELPPGRYLLRVECPVAVQVVADRQVLCEGAPPPDEPPSRLVGFELAARHVVQLAVRCPELPGAAPLVVDLLVDRR